MRSLPSANLRRLHEDRHGECQWPAAEHAVPADLSSKVLRSELPRLTRKRKGVASILIGSENLTSAACTVGGYSSYIGSGNRGRTYLYNVDNYWFEAQ